MKLLSGHPMPESLRRYDYSALMGWQVGQSILCSNTESLRIKAYFERHNQWRFTQRKQPDGSIMLWRKE